MWVGMCLLVCVFVCVCLSVCLSVFVRVRVRVGVRVCVCCRIVFNGGHEPLLYHAEYSADPALKAAAGSAAGVLLHLPGARVKKQAGGAPAHTQTP